MYIYTRKITKPMPDHGVYTALAPRGDKGRHPQVLKPGTWPGTDTALGNDQFQTLAAAHLGLGDPDLSTHVGVPIEAPNRAGTGWRKISDAMDCRATGLHVYTASSPGKAGFSRRHDSLRDRIYREAVRAGLLAHREYAPSPLP
jgi:hypothetical protein